MENFANDLAFGCLSVGLDFDFAGNTNVEGIKSTNFDMNVLSTKRDAYKTNQRLFE